MPTHRDLPPDPPPTEPEPEYEPSDHWLTTFVRRLLYLCVPFIVISVLTSNWRWMYWPPLIVGVLAIFFAIFMIRMGIEFAIVSARAWSLGQILRTKQRITGKEDDDVYIV